MTADQLFAHIQKKQSYLCVGLDPDLEKIPEHLLKEEDPVFAFNKAIIDATKELCVAYKPNLAFYEALGEKGWAGLKKTVEYIPDDIFVMADAKRGDIGNTSDMYAKAFFEDLDCDGVTLSPYMGEDSVKPYLKYDGKWAVVLALTSNSGSIDFQTLQLKEGKFLFQKVLDTSMRWGSVDNLMYVVGATQANMMDEIRQLVPEHFLLVPGVGAQGGDLHGVSQYGLNARCGLLVNSSRGIIYASNGEDFAEAAALKAKELQNEMAVCLDTYL